MNELKEREEFIWAAQNFEGGESHQDRDILFGNPWYEDGVVAVLARKSLTC